VPTILSFKRSGGYFILETAKRVSFSAMKIMPTTWLLPALVFTQGFNPVLDLA
jgi:hypothetical protein